MANERGKSASQTGDPGQQERSGPAGNEPKPAILGDKISGDKVAGDKISIGNIQDSYTAIGAGAQVIVNQIQQALSDVDEMEKGIQAAERRLAESIQKKLIVYIQLTAGEGIDSRRNPYKSLLDYKLEDAPFFYGRSDAIEAMLQKMQQSQLTILHSDSASGKTSLLQAGLASRLLADGQFPLYLRPYNQPPEQFIKKAFLPDYATLAELQRFSDAQMSLRGFLSRVTHYLGERRLIIFLDQFEEFFTELKPEQQQEFSAQLHECVNSNLPVWWVLALRKEYFADLRLFHVLKPYENAYFLPTFKLDEAKEVIIEPAARKGVAYEEGVVEQILRDIRGQSTNIPPAQVQLVCYTLFEELAGKDNSKMISWALYNQHRGRGAGAPGAEGILTSHLTRVLDRELTGQERKVASKVLEALVTADMRRVVRSKESLQSAVDIAQPAQLDEVLRVLFDNRLIRRELDENDLPVYELAHDYLLKEIELDPETQARKAAQELLNQETNAYRQHGTLLSEEKFVIINNQREYLQIDDNAAELLEKSEAAIETERRRELEQEQKLKDAEKLRADEAVQAASSLRKRLILASGAVVLALLALGAAVVLGLQSQSNADIAATAAVEADTQRNAALAASTAEVQQRETAEAALATSDARLVGEIENRSRELELQAAIVDDDTEKLLTYLRAINIAASNNISHTKTAERGLYQHLTTFRLRRTLSGHQEEIIHAGFSPDGSRIVAVGQNNVYVWDMPGDYHASYELDALTNNDDSDSSVDLATTRSVACTEDLFDFCTHWVWFWDSSSDLITFPSKVDLSTPAGIDLNPPAKESDYICSKDDFDSVCLASRIDLRDDEGQLIGSIENSPAVTSYAISPNGQHLVTVSGDQLQLWLISEGYAVELQGNTSGVGFADVSADGNSVITVDFDGMVQLWDDHGSYLSEIGNKVRHVSAANFSPDGTSIFTTDEDGVARLWDLDGRLMAEFKGHDGEVIQAEFHPDGTSVVTAGEDGTVRIWDIEGNQVHIIEGWHETAVISAKFSGDGAYLVTTDVDKNIALWKVNGDVLFVTDFVDEDAGWSSTTMINSDGSAIFTENYYDGGWLWNNQGDLVAYLEAPLFPSDVSFSPDGGTVIMAGCGSVEVDAGYICSAGIVRFWNAQDGTLEYEFNPFPGHVYAAKLNPSGKYLLTAGCPDIHLPDPGGFGDFCERSTVRLWDIDLNAHSEQLLFELGSHRGDVELARFNESGTRVISVGGYDDSVRLLEMYPDLESMLLEAQGRVLPLLGEGECEEYFDEEVCSGS